MRPDPLASEKAVIIADDDEALKIIMRLGVFDKVSKSIALGQRTTVFHKIHWHKRCWVLVSPKLVFTFKDAAQTSVDAPDRPGQKIHGWLFEATWNFGPDSQSNFPMAARFLARADTVVLYAPIGAAFQRWMGEERR